MSQIISNWAHIFDIYQSKSMHSVLDNIAYHNWSMETTTEFIEWLQAEPKSIRFYLVLWDRTLTLTTAFIPKDFAIRKSLSLWKILPQGFIFVITPRKQKIKFIRILSVWCVKSNQVSVALKWCYVFIVFPHLQNSSIYAPHPTHTQWPLLDSSNGGLNIGFLLYMMLWRMAKRYRRDGGEKQKIKENKGKSKWQWRNWRVKICPFLPDLLQAQQALAHAIAQASKTPQHCKLLSTFTRPTTN